MINDLAEFYVTLYENADDKHTIIFRCWADDIDHAKEQAINAYPNGRIVAVEKE